MAELPDMFSLPRQWEGQERTKPGGEPAPPPTEDNAPPQAWLDRLDRQRKLAAQAMADPHYADPISQFFSKYVGPFFGRAFAAGPQPVPVDSGASEYKPLVDPGHPVTQAYQSFRIDNAYARYKELQDEYGNSPEGRTKAGADPELQQLAEEIKWGFPTSFGYIDPSLRMGRDPGASYEAPIGKFAEHLAGESTLGEVQKKAAGEDEGAGETTAEGGAEEGGEPASMLEWAKKASEIQAKYPMTYEGRVAAMKDPELQLALIAGRGIVEDVATGVGGFYKSLVKAAETAKPVRRALGMVRAINKAGNKVEGQEPAFDHLTYRSAPDAALPATGKPEGLAFSVNPTPSEMELLQGYDKALGGAGEVNAVRDRVTGDVHAWPASQGEHGEMIQEVTGRTIEPRLTTPEALPGEAAAPELPQPSEEQLLGGYARENSGGAGTDRLTDAPLHEQRVATWASHLEPIGTAPAGPSRLEPIPNAPMGPAAWQPVMMGDSVQAEVMRQKMAADRAGISQQGAAAIAIQHPDDVDATYAELRRQNDKEQREPFSFSGMEESAGRPPSLAGAALDVLTSMAQTPLALLAAAAMAPKVIYDKYQWLHANPNAAWSDDPALRRTAYQYAFDVAGALNLSEAMGVSQVEGSTILGAGAVRKRGGGAGQGVTPSLPSAASESGTPLTSSSAVTPPLTHRPFFQDSMRPEPSASSTMRPTSPLTLTGPTETFDRSRIGSIDQTSSRYVLQGTSDYKALRDSATKLQPALDASLRETVAGIPGATVYGSRVKDVPGIEAKMATGRPADTISDYLGARIIVKDAASLDKVASALQQKFNVVHVDDFMDQGKFGYRAVHAQVDLGNGTTAELQLVPESVAAVQEQAHALRQPVKRLGELADLTPEQTAMVKDTHAKVQGTFEGAWDPAAFYATREQAGKAITAVDLRALPYPVALEVAKTERHIIPGQEGQFVGAPRGMASRQKLNAMRNDYDAAVDQGVVGSKWYSVARGGINDVAGMDPARQSLLARQWALFSSQATVDTNLGFQLEAHNAWLAGHPLDVAHTGRQARTFNKAMDTGTEIPLSLKTGVFADALDPAKPVPSTGTNDIWQRRAFGYAQENEAGGFSPQEHAFMDAETVLATDRANQRGAGGRSDWNPSEVQAAAWVATKGRSDGLKFYNSKKNVDPRTGKKVATKEQAIDKGIKDAARTFPDYYPKYSAYITEEAIPFVGSGHMKGLEAAPEEVRQKYTDAVSWRDEQGRDRLAADFGMFVRSSTKAVGIYHPPGGAVTEFNPSVVARPMVGFTGETGNRVVDSSSAEMLDGIGAIKGYMAVQGAVPWHLARAQNSMGNSAGYRIPMNRVASHDEMAQLDDLLGPKGLMPIPTGDGITIMPREWGDAAPITQALKTGLADQLKQILPDTKGAFRAGISGGYPSFEDELLAERRGSGRATDKMLKILEANPKIFEAADRSPAVREVALKMLDRDINIWKWEGGKTGPGRDDVKNARELLSQENGFSKLRKALQAGEIALPGVLLYTFLKSVDQDPRS